MHEQYRLMTAADFPGATWVVPDLNGFNLKEFQDE